MPAILNTARARFQYANGILRSNFCLLAMSFWIPKMPNTYRIHATVCSQREREREREKGLMVRDQYCDYCWGSCHAEEEG